MDDSRKFKNKYCRPVKTRLMVLQKRDFHINLKILARYGYWLILTLVFFGVRTSIDAPYTSLDIKN